MRYNLHLIFYMQKVIVMLSVVIPAFNEEKMIPVAAERIGWVLSDAGIPCELIFVDDGSTDGSWEAVRSLSAPEGSDIRIK